MMPSHNRDQIENQAEMREVFEPKGKIKAFAF
jgi:hypothetical protein